MNSTRVKSGFVVAGILICASSEETESELGVELRALGHTLVARDGVGPEFAESVGSLRSDMLLVDIRDWPEGVRSLKELMAGMGKAPPAMLMLVAEPPLAPVSGCPVQDFLLCPYDTGELDSRIRLLLSRSAASNRAKIQVDGLVLDLVSYEVTADGALVQLTSKEYELLKFLAESPGRVFSRPVLVRSIWRYDYLSGSRTVDVHVRRLRAKLGPKYGDLVQTVRNVGYRFAKQR